MRIALVTDGLYPDVIGGMQKHSVLLAQHLAKNEVYVDLYYTARNRSAREAFQYFTSNEKAFIHEVFVDFSYDGRIPGHYLRANKTYSAEVFHLMKIRPPVDLIYAQGFTGWYGCAHRPSWLKAPIAVNLHGLEMFQQSFGLRSKMEQLLLQRPAEKILRNAHFVYSLGGQLTQTLKRFTAPEKIVVQSIGIDSDWLSAEKRVDNTQEATCRFVFIGRNEPRKGLNLLNEVMLRMKSAAAEFHLVGPVDDEARVEQDNVVYHGTVTSESEMIRILDRCHVLVCPSYAEGMPTVILEAMSRGLAVIATDVGAVSELVNEQTGWIISAGNSALLEKAIHNALSCTNRYQKQQNARHLIADRFTWDQVIADTINGFKEMIRANTEDTSAVVNKAST